MRQTNEEEDDCRGKEGNGVMREVLCRGKRADSDEWVFGYYCPCVFGNFPAEPAIIDADELKRGKWAPVKVTRETVGQYTGLKDPYGNPIYEGDIVVPTVLSNIPQCEVVFDVAEGQIVLRDYCGDYHWTLASFGSITDNRYMVVGNKWDNPELLEV